jgi:NAD(P)-dependent dehydrogenase (short-subunit alcohol dehydrogenase family)
MMRGLNGKSILIAGGATGIGAATAVRLAEEGAKVVIGDVNKDGADATAQRIRDAGGEATVHFCDISDDGACRDLVAAAVSDYGRLDGVFNVAADMTPEVVRKDTTLTEVPVEVWKRTLDVNLTGYFLVLRHAIPVLLEAGGGAIVNTLSGLAFYGSSSLAAYQVGKMGLTAMNRHVAEVWGRDGIRCNGVAPGLMLTETALAGLSEEQLAEIRALQRSPRPGRAEDIASATAFLLSEDAEFINGQVLMVTGGRW